jgi:HlyD family secretion protein
MSWLHQELPAGRRAARAPALAVAAALLAACGAPAPAPPPRTALIERGPIEVTVSATGGVAPGAYASLAFGLAGIVGRAPVDVGDQVRAGEPLMELAPLSVGSSIAQAQADLLDAQMALDSLLEPPTSLALAEAEEAVLDAAEAVRDAERRLSGVQHPAVQDYQQALDDARASLQNAESQETLTAIGAETAAVNAAQDAVDRAAQQLGSVQSAEQGCGGCDPDRMRRAQDNYNGAVNSLTSAQLQLEMAQQGHLQAIRDAQEAVDEAQQNLDAAQAGPRLTEVALAEAELNTARARHEQAEQDLIDLQEGPDPDQVAAARARVAAAQARVDELRLVAPFEGTVVAVNFAPGDTVAPGEIAVVVADLDRLHIDTSVDELDIARVTAGQPVMITLDALPGAALRGVIGPINLAPDPARPTTEYPVRVLLDVTDQPVRIGMTAALEILVAQKDDVLLVPNWALQVDRERGGTVVTVQRGGAVVEALVELGLRTDTVSEVLSGLEAGDVVTVQATPEPARGPFGGGD